MTTITKGNNDMAGVSVAVYFLLGIIFLGAFWIWMLPVMSGVTDVHNDITQNHGVPLSDARQEFMEFGQTAYNAYPIIAFVLLIAGAVVFSLRERFGVT